MLDPAAFLGGLAIAFVLASRFPGALAMARQTLVHNTVRLTVWASHAAAWVGRLLLLAFAAVFLLCSVAVIDATPAIAHALTPGPRIALLVAVMGGLTWIGISLVRLWPTTYANIADVWTLGMDGGLTPEEFEQRYGPWQPAPLSIAFWPIAVSGLALASACLWIKFQAVTGGIDGGALLLPIRSVGGMIFAFTLGLVAGLPLAIIAFVTKHSDKFLDPVGVSLLRAVMIFLPGITEESFDRLTEGGTKLNIPLEEIEPMIKNGVLPPIAAITTVFFFAMWVGDGLSTAYLVTLISVASIASFCLWAFGAKKTDVAVKVIGILWGLIILAVIWSFLKDVGAPQAAVAVAAPHRSWFETQWVSLCDSLALSRDLIRQDYGFLKGIGRGLVALILGPVLCGAIVGGALDAKSTVGKAIGLPIGFIALLGALVGLGHVIAIFVGWFTACAS